MYIFLNEILELQTILLTLPPRNRKTSHQRHRNENMLKKKKRKNLKSQNKIFITKREDQSIF